MLSAIRSRTVKKRTILAGLKSDSVSREILLRLLSSVVRAGDSLLAVHVPEENDSFDPNSFLIHEDLCRTKQVDFLIRVCEEDLFVAALAHQVRLNHATMLALGCSLEGPKDSVINACLKRLPPTCTLLVMDIRGRIRLQRKGTSQQGSLRAVFQISRPLPAIVTGTDHSPRTPKLQKSRTISTPLTPPPRSSSSQLSNMQVLNGGSKKVQAPNFMTLKLFQRLKVLEAKGSIRRFQLQELSLATTNFTTVIGEGGHSKVYQANLVDGRAVAVKVLAAHVPLQDLICEVEMLCYVKHENIVEILGFCIGKEFNAIVYNLLEGSLNQCFRQLRWKHRVEVAIGVAKALSYLHHSCNPPIVHRDIKSSNILLSHDCKPQLSDFGSALELHQSQPAQKNRKPYDVVGTFGYLAPEYLMYGNVDEKIDVYSYGVVLLELITGKQAIQESQSNQESLLPWARSLLGCGLSGRLIDPSLHEDYDKEEMENMIIVARLCLLHSSSRRPSMRTILRLLEKPKHFLKMRKTRDELLNETCSKGNQDLCGFEESDTE